MAGKAYYFEMSYPGIESYISGTFTFGHGITPSVATMDIVASGNIAIPSGTLAFRYGRGSNPGIVLEFPDCRLDATNLNVTEAGQIITVRIKDRRWRWEFGKISGRYNILRPDGRVNLLAERTPQQLAKLLLDAMGEKNYDVSQLPNYTRPHVEWAGVTPAIQLARLCESLGCRVVLGTDNKVRLCRLGMGKNLPTGRIMHGGYSFDPPEMPDSLEVVCAPTRYQMMFNLEAVGLDRDGEIKLLKDLSYNPYGEGEKYGWLTQDPYTLPKLIGGDTLSAQTRRLALSSVYRMYRIKEPSTGDMRVPEYGTIKKIDQILPLLPDLLTEETNFAEQYPHAATPRVEGSYFDTNRDPPVEVNESPGTRYVGNFTIDYARGIITFAEPVYRMVVVDNVIKTADGSSFISPAGSFGIWPAELTLECAVNVYDEKTFAPERYIRSRKLTNEKWHTGPKVISREDIGLTVRARYRSAQALAISIGDLLKLSDAEKPPANAIQRDVVTNLKDSGVSKTGPDGLVSQTNYYLDAEFAMYQIAEAVSYAYPGLLNISPDGRIHQVRWSVSSSGAFTEASENSEFDLAVPSFEERRHVEELKQLKKIAGLA